MIKLFNYESKPMQILLIATDMVLLNLLYLLCCLPVFTIGAAQAGLCTGLQALTEGEGYCTRAFFKGFKSGFGRITLAWGMMTAAMVICIYFLVSVLLMKHAGYADAPVLLSLVSFFIISLFQSMLGPFHARFDCSALGLIKNVWYFVLQHPIRCAVTVVLIWLPVVLWAVKTDVFLLLTMFWLLGYYSIAYLCLNTLMKKPFERIESENSDIHL